jgi:hypothetical protein
METQGRVGSGQRQKRRGLAMVSVGLVCFLAVMMIFPTALAGNARASPKANCPSPTVAQIVSTVSELTKGRPLILSVWWSVTNLEDIEISPYYWALDSGVVVLQAWQAPDGSFYAWYPILLHWQTYKGALSPVAGVPEPRGGSGWDVQAEYIHFTGTFHPGSMPVHGYLGNVNTGGTKADILNAPGPQTGSPVYLDPFSAVYFTGVVDVHPLAWSYVYAPTAQEFCGTYDYISGALSYTGDIVT